MENGYDKDHDEVMKLMLSVNGVKEHLESEEVKKHIEDTKKRLEGLDRG